MKKLNDTLAVETGYLKMLQETGSKVLASAKEVTDEIEKYTRQVDAAIDQLPSGVKRTGTQTAITDAARNAGVSLYGNVKSNMEKTLKKMTDEVPRYDKTCGDAANKLVTVTKSLANRIVNLENLVVSGSIAYDDNTFLEQLKRYKEEWENDTESLKKILKQIMNALKGVENEACRYSEDPVNLATGNFIYDREDMKIGGSVPLSFHRYYNSLDERGGVLGTKWKHNYEISLLFEEDNIIVLKEDGREDAFKKDETGYVSITGSVYSIKEINQGYQYAEKYGTIYVFDKLGNLLTISDVNGTQISFKYDEDNRLERAESLSGYLVYHYNDQGKLEEILDHTGRKVAINYEEGRLYQVTTPLKVHYIYTYGADGNLKSIVNPQEVTTVKNRFDKKGRTKKQYFPDGGTMKFSYDDENRMVTLTERNGSEIVYEHDARYRNIRTIYTDGEESYTYNRNNQRTSYTDQNGNRTVYAYDNMGNLTRIVDALGNATHITYGGHEKPIRIKTPEGGEFKYSYDEKGNLIKQVDACGNVTRLQYNDRGKLAKIVQADDSEIVLSYDEKGNIITITRPDGGQITYVYDALNRITCTTDENGNLTRYAYDDADRITVVTNPEGNTKRYTYNASGLVTEITDFDGNRITRGYNVLNKLEWETDKEGNTTRYEYDRMWNISRMVMPNGGEITYRYDGRNRLESVTNPLGGSLSCQYDPCGSLLRIMNAEGESVSYTYDALNRRIGMTDALGNESRIYYDVMGRIIREVDAMGRSFDTVYDRNGNKTAEVNNINGGMSYTYDSMGRVTSMTDGAGRVRSYTYTAGGRTARMTDFDGRTETCIYDKVGNVITRKDSRGMERYYTYDCMNRITEITDGKRVLQQYTYDAVGNCTSVTDANGSRTEYHYTPNGKMERVTDPAGNETSYVYDSMGQLEKVLYPPEGKERTTVYEKNPAGQVTRITDALGNTEVYEYDCYGRMTGKTDRKGQHTGFWHNAMGDITHIRYADGKEVYLSYDPLRQLKELQDWTGTTRIVTDAVGRTREITDAAGNTTAYEWGVMGERTGVVYPDGQKVIYGYDRYLNLKKVTVGEDETVYLYDENGRLSGKQYANGMKSRYTYTAEGRLESLMHEDREGVLDSFRYTYDAVGNCIMEERVRRNLPDESGNYCYAYDVLGRLTAVEKDGDLLKRYEYDAYGNRTAELCEGEEVRYFYNEANQLIRKADWQGVDVYEYDEAGNLLKVIQNGKEMAEYLYDGADNMVSVKTERGIAEYLYNGFGKKIGMTANHQGNKVQAEQTEYILDYTRDYNNLLQRKKDGRTETYFWDENLLSASFDMGDTPLNGKDSVHNMTYLLDQLGSPLHFCNAEGVAENSYGYDVFGADLYAEQHRVTENFTDMEQPFGFTGYEREFVSGLYYAQARRYDAGIGRFTSRDKIKGDVSHLQSQNEYVYCLGNPLMYVDRDGRVPQFVSSEDYEDVGYDENAMPVVRKKDERDRKKETSDADMLDQTYDGVIDGLTIANEANNMIMPQYIKEQPQPKNIGTGIWNKQVAEELAEQSKFYSKAGKVLEKAGYVSVVVDGGISVYNNVQEGTCWQKTVLDLSIDMTVSLELMTLGSLIVEAATSAGALLGTAVPIPIVGTVSGATIGAVIGTVASIVLVKWLGELIYQKDDNGKSFIDKVKDSMWWFANGCPANSCSANK